jgi:hypothetical protein
MPNQHKRPPLCFRPPAADHDWLLERERVTGKSRNAILTEALAAYRETTERATTLAARGKAAP